MDSDKAHDLIEHAEGVRRLARRLVADPEQAEDVAQEAFLQTLRRPPRVGWSLNTWLRGVLRRKIREARRAETRRRRHETAAQRDGEVAATADVVAELEGQRRVLEAVRALPEDYRTVVWLRFFHDRSAALIAQDLGLPVETVRTRIKRGLQRLRESLDPAYGGDGRRWRAALLPLTGLPDFSGSTALAEVAVMGAKVKTACAAAALAIGALALWWSTVHPDKPATDRGHSTEAALAPRAASELPHLSGASSERDANAARVGSASTDEPEPGTPNDLLASGRVVDDRRRPVAGATVTAYADLRLQGRAVSGEDGRFRLRVATRPSSETRHVRLILLLARDASGRADRAYLNALPDSPDTTDIGVLSLRPAHAPRLRVTWNGTPVAGATVHVGFWAWTSGKPVLRTVTDASGIAQIEALPPGVLKVVASQPERGRAVRLVGLPTGSDAPVEIPLAAARSLDVLVVDRETGAPVADAAVDVFESLRRGDSASTMPYVPAPSAPATDASGHTRVSGLDVGTDLVVRVAARDGSPGLWSGEAEVPCGATEVRIHIATTLVRAKQEPARWTVVAGESPVPPDGATIQLRTSLGTPASPIGSGRMEGNVLVVDGSEADLLPHSPFAVAPDGSVAALPAMFGRGMFGRGTQEVSFHPLRRVEVVLSDEHGRPLAGTPVRLRPPGGRSWLGDAVAADAAGSATFPPILACAVEAYAGVADSWVPLGSADLAAGNGRLVATLTDEQEYGLRFRAGGAPLLPGRFRLKGEQEVRLVAEDAERGEIRMRMRLPLGQHEATLTFDSDGWASKEVVVRAGETTEVTLVRTGEVLVDVARPEDGLFHLTLLRWDAPLSQWRTVEHWAPEPVDDGPVRLRGLAPGRYLVMDTVSAAVAGEATVTEAGASQRVALDLSRAGWVEGTVVVEGPHDASMVTVETIGLGGPRTEDRPRTFVGPNGFRVRVPGDRPVALRAKHPVLASAREDGTVHLREPRRGVVLRLVEGNRLRFTVVAPGVAAWYGLARVLLFGGEPAGEPAFAAGGSRDREGELVGGFESGRFTVWIDLGAFAPVVLRDVDLRQGTTSLGAVHPAAGSSLRLTIRRGPEISSTRLEVVAEHLGSPSYRRVVEGHGDEFLVSGLGAGRFHVQVKASLGMSGGGGSRISREVVEEVIELDGVHDAERTVTFR